METLAAKAPSHLIFVTTNETIDQILDLSIPTSHNLSLLDHTILTINICNIHQYAVAFLH